MIISLFDKYLLYRWVGIFPSFGAHPNYLLLYDMENLKITKTAKTTPDSKCKEIRDLYDAGFTEEQVDALVKFIVSCLNKEFHEIIDEEDEFENNIVEY